MNKRLPIQLAVGIIIILALIIGGAFYFTNKKPQTKELSSNKKFEEKILGQKPKLNCEKGWKEYYHDVIGIAFCYPEKWGEPYTDSHPDSYPYRYPYSNSDPITRLKDIVSEYDDKNNRYYDSIYIEFDSEGPSLHFFGDKYQGEYFANSIPDKLGLVDVVSQLKSSENICAYEIKKWNNDETTIEIQNECERYVKTALIENKSIYSQNYEYDLRLYAFKKISNGYFDNILIRNIFDRTSSMEKKLTTLEDFFNAKTRYNSGEERAIKNKEQFNEEKEDFEKFVTTIVAYNPIVETAIAFQKIPGEEKNIETIRRYYWLLSNQKINEAYAMVSNQENITLVQFNNWYSNLNFAKPRDFKKINSSAYEFLVDYQDHNDKERIYHVKMQVLGEKIRTLISEEYISKVVTFGEYEAYVAIRNGKNYVILSKNGKETILDEGVADYNEDYSNINEVKIFSSVYFSSKGNYLIYDWGAWEVGGEVIYDFKKQKEILNLLYPDEYGFSNDEKEFYYCTSAGMATGPGGEIVSLPDGETIYSLDDLFMEPEYSDYMDVECSYDEKIDKVTFVFGNNGISYDDNGNKKEKPLEKKGNL